MVYNKYVGKFIGIILIIVVIAFGGLWLFQNYEKTRLNPGSQNISQPPVAPSDAIISFTDSGFQPKNLTVKIGTAVTFINESSDQMWVASAVHPTHQELPGFDQLESVGAGKEYVYTFIQAGNWRFHNHLAPTNTGVVNVVE